MNRENYDTYRILIKKREDVNSLIVLVDYYKDGKVIEQKRTTNPDFIMRILKTAANTSKNIDYLRQNLIAEYYNDGIITIENYDEIKEAPEFDYFNKKVVKNIKKEEKEEEKEDVNTEVEKKQILSSVKNLKVSRDLTKLSKIKKITFKLLPLATLSIIVMTQIIPIVRNLPTFKLNGSKMTIEAEKETTNSNEEIVSIGTTKITMPELYSELSNEEQEIVSKTLNPTLEPTLPLEETLTKEENPTDEVPAAKVPTIDPTISESESNQVESTENQNIEVTLEQKEEATPNQTEKTLVTSQELQNELETVTSLPQEKETIENNPEANEKEEVLSDNTSNSQDTIQESTTTSESSDIVETSLSDNDDLFISSPTIEPTPSSLPIEDSVVEEIEPTITPTPASTPVLETQNQEITTDDQQQENEILETNLTDTISNSELSSYANTESSEFPIFKSKSYIDSVTEDEFYKMAAVVAGEDSYSYEGALATISTVLNRCDTAKYQEYGGENPYSQLFYPSQFTAKDANLAQRYMNHPEEIPDYVIAAVTDGLNGYRNHTYTSFRAGNGDNRVRIGDHGNYYFNSSSEVTNYGYVTDTNKTI